MSVIPLDPIQRDNLTQPRAFWLESQLATPNIPGNALMPFPTGRAYPLQSEYPSEELWLKAMANYFVSIIRPSIGRYQAQRRMALDLYSQVTEISQTPIYGRDPEQLQSMPMERFFLNALYPIINTKQGEFSTKEYVVRSFVTNQEAQSRRSDFLKSMLADVLIKEADPNALADLGIPESNPVLNEAFMRFEGTIQEFMEQNYRDVYASLMERMLSDWMEMSNFDTWLSQTYKFYLLTNTAIATPYINERTMEVELPLVRPDDFVPDLRSRDNYFENSVFSIRFSWDVLENVQMRYPHLTREELQQVVGMRTSFFGIPMFRQDQDGRFYVIVMHLEFRQPKQVRQKVEGPVGAEVKVSTNGPYYDIEVEEKVESREYVEAYEELYFADIIGGLLYADGGVVKNQIRSANDPAKAHLNSETLIYDYSVSQGIPNNTLRVAVLIEQRNYTLFKLMNIIGSIQASKLVIDPRIIPSFDETISKDESLRAWFQQMKENNLILADYSEASLIPGMQQDAVRVINISDRDVALVQQLVDFINVIDQQINSYMGFSAARTGKISQYAAAKNIEVELTQSDLATADERLAFEKWVERVLTKVANLQKIAILAVMDRAKAGDAMARQKLDLYKIRYGDEIVMLSEGLIFEDFGIKVKRRQNPDEALRKLDQVMQIALQQGSDPSMLRAYVRMFDATDVDEARRVVENFLRTQEMRAEKQAADQMAMQQQAQQQAIEAQTGAQLEANAASNQAMLERERIKQSAMAGQTQ